MLLPPGGQRKAGAKRDLTYQLDGGSERGFAKRGRMTVQERSMPSISLAE